MLANVPPIVAPLQGDCLTEQRPLSLLPRYVWATGYRPLLRGGDKSTTHVLWMEKPRV